METTAAKNVQITGIDISTYLVKDPDRAVAFWRDKMGLNVTHLFEGRGAEFELPDGSAFGLWKMEDGSWSPGNGIMFAVSDIQQAIDYYRGRGVKIEGPEESPVCHMAFGEDTEGNNFILHQRKQT